MPATTHSLDGYYREKFGAAVQCLIGQGDLTDRIERAMRELITVDPSKISQSDHAARYQEIVTALNLKEAEGDEGRHRASLREMSEDQVECISQDLLAIHNGLLAQR